MSVARKLRCVVESVADHGGRVYTVELSPEKTAPPFKPGQFLHLTVDEYDPAGFWPESRVFSIASPPRRLPIRLCYAVKGRYTAKMEASLKAGAEVWVKLPYGDFVIDGALDSVLIAGGTGISAFSAFLEGLTPADPRRVLLVYGARSPSLFLFQDAIQAQLAKVPNLSAVFFAEADGPGTPPAGCRAGRICLDQVWPLLGEPAGRVFYLSGPPVMLKALAEGLRRRGVPEEGIRTDAWE